MNDISHELKKQCGTYHTFASFSTEKKVFCGKNVISEAERSDKIRVCEFSCSDAVRFQHF